MLSIICAESMAYIAAALAIAVTGLGSAFAMGFSISKAMDAIARQPEVAGNVRSTLIVGLAFCETLSIYGLLVAIIITTAG